MHARDQFEIACWMAAHAADVIDGIDVTQIQTFERFWLHHRSRANRWAIALKTFQDDLRCIRPDFDPWPALEIVLEEVLVSEGATRIWTALCVVLAQITGIDRLGLLARSAFITHIESRNRALRILLEFQHTNSAAFARFNRTRNLVEKWTDLFLSLIPWTEISIQFAFDPKRVHDHEREQQEDSGALASERVEIWLNAAEHGMRGQCQKWMANPDLNRRMVESLLLIIDWGRSDATRIPAGLGQLIPESGHVRTQNLMDGLAHLDRSTVSFPRDAN